MLLALVLGCNHSSPVTPPETVTLIPGPGKFGLSHLNGLAKKSGIAAVQSGENVSFDLGPIKGSSAFYFLLYNIGTTPITDVALSIADSSFSVYPAKMDTLMPGGDLGMLPIVKVSVYHGTALDGAGYRPLMPMGDNKADVTITGTTKTRSGVDTTVTLTAGLDLKALVMDIAAPAISLGSPAGNIMSSFPDGISTMPFYNAPGCSVVVQNTGNVPVTLRTFYKLMITTANAYFDTVDYTLGIGQVIEVPRFNADVVFSVDGNNTVPDPAGLSLYPNGKCYFYLRAGSTNCQATSDTLLHIGSFLSLVGSQSALYATVTNRLFLIDSAMVFWEFTGNCPGGSGPIYRLYGTTANIQLGYYSNIPPIGLTQYYSSQQAHDMLDTIRANLSAADLGLGAGHSVEQVPLN
jgi:hypothetical protein